MRMMKAQPGCELMNCESVNLLDYNLCSCGEGTNELIGGECLAQVRGQSRTGDWVQKFRDPLVPTGFCGTCRPIEHAAPEPNQVGET